MGKAGTLTLAQAQQRLETTWRDLTSWLCEGKSNVSGLRDKQLIENLATVLEEHE